MANFDTIPEQKPRLQVMRCPTCGGDLKVDKPNEPLVCVCCGNLVVPVTQNDAPKKTQPETIRIEGLKTASSALAYLEQFFDEFDWDAFLYASELFPEETELLVRERKMIAADDPATWELCFRACREPWQHKLEDSKKLLQTAIAAYEKEDPDAYSHYDTYKRITALLSREQSNVFARLETYALNAEKYGGDKELAASMSISISRLRQIPLPHRWNTLEEVPQIQAIIEKRTAQVVARLAAQGVDANAQYQEARSLMDQARYVEALNILLELDGYLDSDKLAQQINRFYSIDQALEICNRLFYYQKQPNETFSIYSVTKGSIDEKPLLKRIRQVVANYADILYFVNDKNKLCRYSFSQGGKPTPLFKTSVDPKTFHEGQDGRKLYFLLSAEDSYAAAAQLMELDLATAQVSQLQEDVTQLVALTEGRLIYRRGKTTLVMDTKTHAATQVSKRKATVHGFVDDFVLFTVQAPNSKNLDLYRKPLTEEPAILIEPNIYSFCGIAADKLYYHVGSSRDNVTISCAPDGTGRRELPIQISEILFEQGGWVYYIFRVGYNAVLCRALPDGSRRSIIASDIESFIKIAGGAMYYIDDKESLVKVRMNGTGRQKLCHRVKKVLCIRDERIVFLSLDDRSKTDEYGSARQIRSIYEIPFDGSGKRKLVYNVSAAEEYGDNAICYLTEDHFLCRMDLTDRSVIKLFTVEEVSQSSGCLGPALLVLLCLFITFIGIMTYETTLLILGLIGALICGIVGIARKANS